MPPHIPRPGEPGFDELRAKIAKSIAEIERGEYDEVEDFKKYFDDIIAEVDRELAAERSTHPSPSPATGRSSPPK